MPNTQVKDRFLFHKLLSERTDR